ncbi:MAG: hypothetical protein IJ719_11165 [Clostridia bacterium]|nr:hypothetical protein [Clostridia bacterium]
MAAATMEAPKRSQNTTAGAGKGAKQQVKKTLPQAAGIGILALLLVISLFVGNMRALQKATPGSFLKQGDVSSIVEDRAKAAKNVKKVVTNSLNVDPAVLDALDDAVEEFTTAKSARGLSRANQNLTTVVSEMTADAMQQLSSEEERSYLRKANDNFTEDGDILRQEARTFNAKAEKALALYEKLPTKFILSKPDVFEGL